MTPRRPTATPCEGPVMSIANRAREETGAMEVQVFPISFEPTVAPAEPTAQKTFSFADDTAFRDSVVPDDAAVQAPPLSLRNMVPFSPVAIRVSGAATTSP